MFFPLYSMAGASASALAILPVVLNAWSLGLRGGLLAAVSALLLNAFFLGLAGLPAWSTVFERGGPGALGMILVAMLVGRTSEMNQQLRRQVQARSRAEQQLHILSNAMEQVADAVVVTDREGVILYVNPAWERLTGHASQEALGKTPRIVKSGRHDLEFYRRLWATILAGHKWQAELVNRRKDGGFIDVEQTITPIFDDRGSITHFVGIERDVTRRKQAQAALRESEARYRTLAEAAHDMIFIIGCDGCVQYVNTFAAAQLNRLPEEIIGRPLEAFFPPDISIRQARSLKRVFETGQPLYAETKTSFPARERWLGTWLVPLRNEAGDVTGALGISRDITDRKRVEEALRDSEERYRIITELISDYAYAYRIEPDASPVLEWVTGAYARITGYSPEENSAPGAWQRVIHPDDRSLVEGHVSRMFAGEEGSTEYRIVTRNGEVRWLRDSFRPGRDEADGRLVTIYGAAEDITERKRAEDELRHRLGELEAVNRISTALRTAQTLDDMLPRLLDETLDVLGTSAGAIWLLNPSADELRLAVARGWLAAIQEPIRPGEGIAGRVFESSELHMADEFAADAQVRPLVRSSIPAGWGGAAIPIRSTEETLGVLGVAVSRPRRLQPEETRLLTTLAEIAGNAIHRTRLHAQTERRMQRLAALHTIDMAIGASVDLRLTLNVLLDQVTAQLGVDAADVLLLSPHSHSLEYTAGRGFLTDGLTPTRLALGRGLAGRAALERRIVEIRDVWSQAGEVAPRSLLGKLQAEGVVAYFGVPLVAKGRVMGVLEIFHRTRLESEPEWLEFLATLAGQAAIAISDAQLFDGLQRSNTELALAYDVTIEGWGRALELRDRETEGHTRRVTEITLALARAYGIGPDEIVHIRRGALLHDIGKMGIPDAILSKPGPLTDDEWAIMRQHPRYAFDMLSPIAYLRPAMDIPYCHHEKWDGTGYPRGMRGEEIPIAARLFGVADVWDALTSDRPYRSAWLPDQARGYIRNQAGRHFDPRVVELFLAVVNEA